MYVFKPYIQLRGYEFDCTLYKQRADLKLLSMRSKPHKYNLKQSVMGSMALTYVEEREAVKDIGENDFIKS